MIDELKTRRDSELAEFNNAQEQLEKTQKNVNILQQEVVAITNFMLEKKGRILLLNELIGPENNEELVKENNEE